jgi:hypothetical protein
VQTDAGGALDEYPNDGNNVAKLPLYVEPVPLSDLVTTNVVAPVQAIQGAEVEVRFTVTNRGAGTTAGDKWTDTIWLTADRTRPNAGGNGATLIGSIPHQGHLAVGESYSVVTKVNLPDKVSPGTYFITPWSDSYDVVLEDTLAANINLDDPNELDCNNYNLPFTTYN